MSFRGGEDVRFWSASSDGVLRVKDIYHLARQAKEDEERSTGSDPC